MNRYAILDIVLSSYSWAKRPQLVANKRAKTMSHQGAFPELWDRLARDEEMAMISGCRSLSLQVCRSAGGLHNQGKDDQGPRMSQSQADIDV